jgi:D-sedoheptulose 7-phosphate isomerase
LKSKLVSVSQKNFINSYLKTYKNLLSVDVSYEISRLKEKMLETRTKKAKLIFAGNGASSSIASHCALDFSKQAKIKSLCFSDPSYITALSNDCGYEEWVKVALSHHLELNDLVILISSSGNSENIIRAAQYAKEQNATIVGFSGMKSNNRLRSLCDFDFWVDNMSYNIIENIHSIWLTIICDLIIGSREYSVE